MAIIGLLRRSVLILIVTLGASWCLARAEDQLPPQADAAINQIASRAQADQQVLAGLLRRYGFPPSDWTQEAWREFPAMPGIEQLEFAWLSAERAETGAGDKLLENIIADYKVLNTSAAAEPALKAIEHSGQLHFQFAVLQGTDIGPLPSRVETLLDGLSRHVDGQLRAHIGRCCGIEGADARRILRSARNPKEALRIALREGLLPPELVKKLAFLIDGVAAIDPSVSLEAELADVREQLRSLQVARNPDVRGEIAVLREQQAMAQLSASLEATIKGQVASAFEKAKVTSKDMRVTGNIAQMLSDLGPSAPSVPGPPVRPTPPGHPSSQVPLSVAARNAAFDVEQYGSRAALPHAVERSFARVVLRAVGRGGVVFGNAVSADPTLPKPLSIVWVPLESSGPPTVGTFRIRLSGDRIVFSIPLPAAEALAAVRLVFTGVDGITSPVSEGNEIGMAGLDGHFELPNVVDARVTFTRPTETHHSPNARGTSYVVHPAIADQSAGQRSSPTHCLWEHLRLSC
jgi:hypothetical protein